MTEIIVAVITGIATVLAVIFTNSRSSRDMDAKLDKAQAITETKLDELTREVRIHNGFAQRVPVLEEQMRSTDNRLKNLESHHVDV
ncbi:MAG: hypothetical protein ACI3YE_03325 [Candidatus Avispirillum sp.]